MADYQNLASISKPTMMPKAPLGGGFTAGWMYGRDKAEHEGFLAQAAKQAELQAQMEAQKAEELAAGRPGRLDTINLGNLKAKNALSQYQNGGSELEAAKQFEELTKTIEPYMTTLATATDDATAREAYEAIVKIAPAFGTNMKFEDLRKMARAKYKGDRANPKHANAMELEGKKGENRLANTKAAAEARSQLEDKKMKFKKALEEAKAAKAGNKPLTESQMKAQVYGRLLESGALTEEQIAQMWHDEALRANPTDVAKAGTGAAITGLPIERPATPQIPFNPRKSKTQEPVIGGMWNDGKKEQEIVNIKRDPKGKAIALKLKDGTIVPLNMVD